MECQELSHMYNDNHEALATLFKEDYKVPSQATPPALWHGHATPSETSCAALCKRRRGRFRCGNSSSTIPQEAVNDNYCDCPGSVWSDEPGTAACAGTGAVFTCRDGRLLPTAFVDDGICDCCDGADEGPYLYRPASVQTGPFLIEVH
eukprot:jgi/Astpho2/3941/Aster-x1186